MNAYWIIFSLVIAGSPQEVAEPPPQPLVRQRQFEQVDVTLQVSDRSPTVADRVDVSLTVTSPLDFEIELPDATIVGEPFEVHALRRAGPIIANDGRRLWTLSFKIEVPAAGEHSLPALPFRFRQVGSEWTEVATDPVPLLFRSLLGDDPAPKPNPGPADWPREPWNIRSIATAVSATVFVIAALILLWIRLSRRRAVEPKISAYERAMQAMRAVEQARWLESGDADRFYTELSGVLRHYIEDRFGVRAPEQTTEEFFAELADRPVLTREQRESLQNFLERCDLVKFAKARPTTAEGLAALEAARHFVESTREDSGRVTLASTVAHNRS